MGGQAQAWSIPAEDTSDGHAPVPATPPRRPLATARSVVVFAAVVALLVVFQQLTAQGNGGQDVVGGERVAPLTAKDRPTPSRLTTDSPLGRPAAAPANPGPYTFQSVQPGSDDPVTYDPCRTVPYVVNTRTAPTGTDNLVRDAVEQISDATGLRFVYKGTTDEAISLPRPPFQPDRYGDRWAPVLISWSDPAEVPDLAGDIAGIGGSTAISTGGRDPVVFVSGIVAIDGPQVDTIINSSYTGKLQASAVIVHELAHLVGLDHVNDPSQLMHDSSGTVDLQSGDLAGLTRLGAGPCVARL